MYPRALLLALQLATVTSVENCGRSIFTQAMLFCATIGLTSFIFFLRIRAIFFAKRTATASFLVLWFGVIGSCVSTAISIRKTQFQKATFGAGNLSTIGGSSLGIPRCELSKMDAGCLPCFIASAAFDTIIFVALSWRILSYCASEDDVKTRLMYFFGRLQLPYISEKVLRGAQKYYMLVLPFILAEYRR